VAVLALQLDNAEALSILKKLGYSGTAKRVEAEMKRDALTMEMLSRELESADTKKPDTQSGEMDFIEWVVVLSKAAGYRIDRDKITVAEFLTVNKVVAKEGKAKGLKIR
jgi:hypothetical protein